MSYGREAKLDGHRFENLLSEHLTTMFGREFIVAGESNTKVDIRSACNKVRISVKNPSKKNTQIGLYTQKRFIECFEIQEDELLAFIEMFFGSNNYAHKPRHRMSKSDIPEHINDKFTDFMNDNRGRMMDLLVSHGHKQLGDVNYMIVADKKNSVNAPIVINIDRFKEYLTQGKWYQNETTFEYRVDDNKIFHLQMKGSGKKYTSGYHALMFHIHKNFDERYLTNLEEIGSVIC